MQNDSFKLFSCELYVITPMVHLLQESDIRLCISVRHFLLMLVSGNYVKQTTRITSYCGSFGSVYVLQLPGNLLFLTDGLVACSF